VIPRPQGLLTPPIVGVALIHDRAFQPFLVPGSAMSESDSEASDLDYLSPMASDLDYLPPIAAASSLHGASERPSYSRHLSFETTLRHLAGEADNRGAKDHERTPLMARGHDRLRRYHSNPAFYPLQRVVEPGATPPVQNGLRRKISRLLQPKAYDYDTDKHSLAAVGSGERVW